jgi:hypothetical protein
LRRRADAVPGRPIRLPRRGRQRLSWPGGYEGWVAEDSDLEAAWGITPARFLFERALPQLVELPALWTSIPLSDRDVEEVLPAIESIVTDHALPEPHLVVSDRDRVVVLWHIRPLHYPAALKADATDEEKALHDRQTHAFRRCLRDWKRAAVKLRLAFAGAGALPHTPATVEQQLLEFIPFPLEPDHPARLVTDLDADPPRVWRSADHGPVLIKDVSMALSAFDQGMWATFKEARPRRGRATAWMQSEATLAALATTEAGDRHKAALTIVCACVWDGLPEDEALRILREWAARCSHDGTFPWRRHHGDELELLVAWAYKRLSPGGPTPRDPTGGDGGPGGGGSGGRRGLTPATRRRRPSSPSWRRRPALTGSWPPRCPSCAGRPRWAGSRAAAAPPRGAHLAHDPEAGPRHPQGPRPPRAGGRPRRPHLVQPVPSAGGARGCWRRRRGVLWGATAVGSGGRRDRAFGVDPSFTGPKEGESVGPSLAPGFQRRGSGGRLPQGERGPGRGASSSRHPASRRPARRRVDRANPAGDGSSPRTSFRPRRRRRQKPTRYRGLPRHGPRACAERGRRGCCRCPSSRPRTRPASANVVVAAAMKCRR